MPIDDFKQSGGPSFSGGISDIISVTGQRPGTGYAPIIGGGYVPDQYARDTEAMLNEGVLSGEEALQDAIARGEIPPPEAAPDLYDAQGRFIGAVSDTPAPTIPAGLTGADFVSGNIGYSFEDFYNDLLNMDAAEQREYLRSQGLLPDEGAAPTTATGGTGVQTDETISGAPSAVTPPTTTPPAETEPTSSATVGTTTPAGGSRTYAGVPEEILDMIEVGVEIPIPGPGNMMLPVIFGSVGEFIDWVQSVGIDPTTGNPDDFMGTVGRVIGDVFTTAKDALEGALRGATTEQANRVDQFIRDLIKAGQTDAGTIVNAAQDALPNILGGGASAGTPPTTGTTTTPGTGPDLGLPGGEEEDDDGEAPAEPAEPGADVDSEGVPTDAGTGTEPPVDAGTEPPVDAGTETLVDADVPTFDDSAINERLDTLGTSQEEVLGKLDEAIDQGATNQEAVQQVADDLGVAVEDLTGALGTTEENLTEYVDSTRDAILEQVGTNQAEVLGKLDEAIAQGATNQEAIQQVADDLGVAVEDLTTAMNTSVEGLTEYIEGMEGRITGRIDEAIAQGATNQEAIQQVADDLGVAVEDLTGYMGGLEARVNERLDTLGTNQEEVLGRLDEAIAQGATNEEAIQQVADDLGVAVEDLTAVMGASVEELGGQIDALREEGQAGRQAILEQMGTNQEEVLGKLDDAIAQGATNQEAIQQVADDLGVAVEDLLGAMDTNTEVLGARIDELRAESAEGRQAILDQMAANEAAGMDRDAALDDAINTVADDLGVTRDSILDELGTTRDDLRDEIGRTEEQLGTQISDLGRQIGARDLIGMLSQPGVLSQQVDVGEVELADIGDLYDFSSIFRTPEQAARFATPYSDAEVQLLRDLGVL